MRLRTHDTRAGTGARQTERSARARLLRGLPLEEHRLDLDGTATAVLEGGHGPPLVLLHGGIECGGAYWAPVVVGLAHHHHVVVPDMPGLGESDPVARLDDRSFGAWLAALLRTTCDEPPTLVAHSLSGTLAARFAARRGELLRRVVVYGAPGIGPYRMPLGLRVVAIRFAVRPTAANAERFERWAFVDLDRTRRRDPEWFDAFSAYLRARAAVPHVTRTMRQLVGSCTKQVPDSELQDIGVPATLVWGAGDRFVPLRLAQQACARRGWPLHVIEDAGHATHIEQPEAFRGVLEDLTRPHR
jgi:2-hydroxymuconate-semialdehyde hydrolase